MQKLKSSSIKKNISIEGVRVGIVVSRFNSQITSKLLKGALQALKESGLDEEDILVKEVPGAFEIPLASQWMLESGEANVDAVICLGAVIRGDTSHYDYVCQGVTQGIMQVQLNMGTVLGFGILTTDNEQQALDRCREDDSNKGYEAAKVVLEMLALEDEFYGE
ncbi:MAG: 6,7-dimethyl-8-ribityllumazine synthase [Deltaproteobacteria bacterium]|nr:6,7-dimethyl-8-ribityllumazine synthase [Deltaproteobacteria bacterium]